MLDTLTFTDQVSQIMYSPEDHELLQHTNKPLTTEMMSNWEPTVFYMIKVKEIQLLQLYN